MASIQLNNLTPQYNLGLTPCLDCASESELMIMLLWMIAYLNGDQDDLPGLLETTKCWDCSSLSDKKLLEAVLGGLANAYRISASQLIADSKCMPCARPGQIKGALAYSILKYFTSLPA